MAGRADQLASPVTCLKLIHPLLSAHLTTGKLVRPRRVWNTGSASGVEQSKTTQLTPPVNIGRLIVEETARERSPSLKTKAETYRLLCRLIYIVRREFALPMRR